MTFSPLDARKTMRTRIMQTYVEAAEASAAISMVSGPCFVSDHQDCDGVARPNSLAELECLCPCHDQDDPRHADHRPLSPGMVTT